MDEKKMKIPGDIPAGIMKCCLDSYIFILTKIVNTSSSSERGCFPIQLKLAEATPVFEKEEQLSLG